MASIDQVFEPLLKRQDSYQVLVSDNWSQGRTLYGGITAALVYQALENEISDGRPIRSVQCNFVGPLRANHPIEIRTRLLRTGGNVTMLTGEALQDGQVGVFMQASFGVARDSSLNQPNVEDHRLPDPAEFEPFASEAVSHPMLPPCFGNFDMALRQGTRFFRGSEDSDLHGWCRFNQAGKPAAMSNAFLIALLDCWPPTMFQMLDAPAQGSTMSWSIEFIKPTTLSPDDWLACVCEAYHVQDGYGHEEAKFWDPQGNLVAIARQVLTIFA